MILLIFGFSCIQKKIVNNELENNNKLLDSILIVEKFASNIDYTPLSLMYHKKPIFYIGQSINTIDSSLSYRPDPNYDYQDYFHLVKDYLSLDDYLSIRLNENSSINGIIFFSVDQRKNQIFNVAGSWTFDLLDTTLNKVAIDSVTTHLFPVLKNKLTIKNNWKYKHEKTHQIEKWDLIKKDRLNSWSLEYNVQLK